MDKLELVSLLSGKEPEAVTRTMALMAYIPSIGRVLQAGGVGKFADLVVEMMPKFYGLVTREHFDTIHAQTCERILASFKTNKGKSLSYGQAQKPWNIFLKVYVDWARRPDPELAEKLTPLLHVPLDSLVMKFMAREFRAEYDVRIAQLRRQFVERAAQRLTGHLPDATPRMIGQALLGNEFSLVGMNKEMYLAWQEFLRSLWPGKPVMLDIIWVLERAKVPPLGIDEKESLGPKAESC
jgi:hypothetical protein